METSTTSTTVPTTATTAGSTPTSFVAGAETEAQFVNADAAVTTSFAGANGSSTSFAILVFFVLLGVGVWLLRRAV